MDKWGQQEIDMLKQTAGTTEMNVLDQYELHQDEITKLLAQIKIGLELHDRNASAQGGHHWGHVGDLNSIAAELRDIRDRLHKTGEYAKG